MNAINDGGQAFPIPADYPRELIVGMTLRDYFAAQALPAWLAHLSCNGKESVSGAYAGIADECYLLADAMIAARSRDDKL